MPIGKTKMTELEIEISKFAKSGLPKWPQMLVTGKSVTIEQAKEIIFKTDYFLTDASEYAGGNNREFNKNYRKMSKLDTLIIKSGDHNRTDWQALDNIRANLGILRLGYVTNDWASCCFIGGPHGWCHPNGKIFYEDNIGKWPSISEVYLEWQEIAQKFPFLDLTVTLVNNDDEESFPVINIRVINGAVTLGKPDLSEHGVTQYTQGERQFFNPFKNEQGLPSEWIEEYAARVKKAVTTYFTIHGKKK
jgi:hypothetical protein